MTTIDLKKRFSHLYNPSKKEFSVVEVPPMNFLMVDGHGDPNTSEDYRNALQALFNVSYTLKFLLKKGPAELDYTVMPLEGLWWSGESADFLISNKATWYWTAMIMQPEFITEAHVEKALHDVEKKKNLPDLRRIRFDCFEEGPAAQIMYIGSYANEGPTIAKMHDFIRENGWKLSGRHHEIYLSDPRRTPPEKLKTIIRQPFYRMD